MILLELSRSKALTGWTANDLPFIRWARLGEVTLAGYWTSWTGETGSLADIFINQVTERNSINYAKAMTLADCKLQPQSFYWDNGAQILYVHLIHASDFTAPHFSYGVSQGFSKGDMVYVDDVEFLPTLLTVPATAQNVDLDNYDLLNFAGGTIEIDNTSGLMDEVIDSPIYGNQLTFSQAPDGSSNLTRSQLQTIASYYVEDYGFSVSKLSIRAMDKRKEQNAQVIQEYMPDGTPVPVMFGVVRSAKALPVNPDATGTITFRVAQALTSLGTVQVDIAGVWTTRTPTAIDLATGQFTLSASDGRQDGLAANGPLDCRVSLPIGYPITYTSDIIVKLNESILGIVFNNSNYDTAEWESEQLALSSGGVLFSDEITIFDAIRVVQNSSSIGFRYEINHDNLRTFRIDDWDRPQSFAIDREEIVDQNVLKVESDSTLLAARAVIKHSQDYNSGRFLALVDSTRETDVVNTYRQKPSLTIETILTNEIDAQTRATWSLDRLSVVRRVVSITVLDNLGLRILDIGTVDLALENGRQYFGRWKVCVIGIKPDYTKRTNVVKLVLIEEV